MKELSYIETSSEDAVISSSSSSQNAAVSWARKNTKDGITDVDINKCAWTSACEFESKAKKVSMDVFASLYYERNEQ